MIDRLEKEKLANALKEDFKLGVTITKQQLIDWILRKQSKNPKFCSFIRVAELIQVAVNNDYIIKGYMGKYKKEEIKCSKEELIKLLKNNTVSKIAEKKGVSYKKICELMKKYKIRKPRRKLVTREQLQELYNNCTTEVIIKKLCVSRSKLYKLFKKYNINLTKKSFNNK